MQTNPTGYPLVTSMKEVSRDGRRSIAESTQGGVSQQIVTTLKDKAVLGNHWHGHTTEEFVLVSGGGALYLQSVDLTGTPCGDVEGIKIHPGSTITVLPRIVHTFVLSEGSVLVCRMSTPFHPKNMDRTTVELVDPVTGNLK